MTLLLTVAAWCACVGIALIVLGEALKMVARWSNDERVATFAYWRRMLLAPTWCAGCDGVFALRWFRWLDHDRFRCRDCVADDLRGDR